MKTVATLGHLPGRTAAGRACWQNQVLEKTTPIRHRRALLFRDDNRLRTTDGHRHTDDSGQALTSTKSHASGIR